jgi:hypothetical protein
MQPSRLRQEVPAALRQQLCPRVAIPPLRSASSPQTRVFQVYSGEGQAGESHGQFFIFIFILFVQ